MDWCHLDTSQLECIYSMWELCRIVKQLLSYSPCSECIRFVAMHSCGANAIVFPCCVACKQTEGLCLLWKVLCNQSSWTYSHVMLWFLENKVYWSLFFVCGCSVESYLFVACATCNCTTKGHPRPLPCQQECCIHVDLS